MTGPDLRREYGDAPARPVLNVRPRRDADATPAAEGASGVGSGSGSAESTPAGSPSAAETAPRRPSLRTSRAQSTTSAPRRFRSSWGDRGAFLPRTIGKRARAAEVAWQLAPLCDVPDTVLDGGRLGPLEVRAAATRGTSHRCDGTVRQDAMGLLTHRDGFLLAAVADGLGSASDSHRGAQFAVRHSLDYVSWALDRRRMSEVDLEAAIDAADRAIRAAGPRPEDRASTLTVAVTSVEPYNFGHEFRVARVGDGSAFLLSDGEFRQLFGGKDAGGQDTDGQDAAVHDTRTACLPDRTGAVELVEGRLEPGQALVLVTDGVGIPLTVPEIATYLAECWSEPPGPVEFLHAMQFRAKSFDDDRSAVVIWAPKAAS